MSDAKERAARLVGQAFDFPAVREDNLLHDGEAEASAARVGREIRFENLAAPFRRRIRGSQVISLVAL